MTASVTVTVTLDSERTATGSLTRITGKSGELRWHASRHSSWGQAPSLRHCPHTGGPRSGSLASLRLKALRHVSPLTRRPSPSHADSLEMQAVAQVQVPVMPVAAAAANLNLKLTLTDERR